MDLIDQLNQIAARIPKQIDHLQSEEATKNALVLPFLNALGYNVFDPTEVVPEFTADVGTKKGEKVDYAIMRDGSPAVLIECKTAGSKLSFNHASQTFRYFSVTDARFAILTNGIDYQFYTDIEVPNRMDEKPFFEFSMVNLDAKSVEEVKKFAKTNFDLNNILSNASELKYEKQIISLLAQELESPSEDFVRHFTQQVYSGKFTQSVKEQFTPLVRGAFREFLKERVNERIQSALDGSSQQEVKEQPAESSDSSDETESEGDQIVTTPEEQEGFNIIRAILAKHVDPNRVAIRDTKSYCGVLLDDNNRKPICRLRFNHSQKYLGLFDSEKTEEKKPIEAPTDIFKYESAIVQTIGVYDNPESSEARENHDTQGTSTSFPSTSH